MSENTVAYVGSRTTPGRKGRGKGIEVYDVGPAADRWARLQTGAKPHQVAFAPDGRFLVVPDKGLDRVFTLALDATSGKLSFGPAPHTATREMAGPHHLCFHPCLPYAYTIDELRSTVTTYRWDAARGALEALQTLLQPRRPRGHHPRGPGARHHRRLRGLGGGRNAAAGGMALHRGHPAAVLLLRPSGGVLATGSPVCVVFSRPPRSGRAS